MRFRKQKTFLIRFIVFTSIVFLFAICAETSTTLGNIIFGVGKYFSPDNSFQARLTIESMGGYKICEISKNGKAIYRVNDINAIVWIDETKVLYSVSPIYGKPGIYLFDCNEIIERVLIGPANQNEAYPNGADYFELAEYSISKKTIYYYYASDVDLIDFGTFRNDKNKRKQILK